VRPEPIARREALVGAGWRIYGRDGAVARLGIKPTTLASRIKMLGINSIRSASRERDHKEGRGGSDTAKRRPVHIVYAEQHSSRKDALKRERQIKRWTAQKKERLVRDLAALSGTSQRARIRTGFMWKAG
jgi:predicted GIY-YIG superfamily endonuclease